ncbi:hypothetical protein M0802_011621 [Mischocyttarus mexicanus]|nr:hypothetical protein M0802_011621 [Mischocyttarus mexicanus]
MLGLYVEDDDDDDDVDNVDDDDDDRHVVSPGRKRRRKKGLGERELGGVWLVKVGKRGEKRGWSDIVSALSRRKILEKNRSTFWSGTKDASPCEEEEAAGGEEEEAWLWRGGG